MYRLVVSYRAEADGSLVPCGPPSKRQRATGEGLLYREIARLVDAEPAAIAVAASRLGPLGPTSEVASLVDERTLVWQLGVGMGTFIDSLDELNHWIATGGSIEIAIPEHLAPAAKLIAALAQMDPELSAGVRDALGEYPSITTGDRTRLRGTFWDEGLGALARYDSTSNTTARQDAQGEQRVYVTVPPGVGAAGLLRARELLKRTWAAMGRDGGMAAVVEPRSIGRFATLASQYRSGQDTGLSVLQGVDDWRRAAVELAAWGEAVRLLRGLAAGRDGAEQLDALLGQLREFAGVGTPEEPRPAARPADKIDTLRGSAASLLTLRLQQVDAWPLPDDDIVGAFGRALWSLWSPITGKRAPMRCQWPAGCLRLLPEGVHGNRRHCDEHKREADRQRAARNRSRLSTARAPQETGGGGPPTML